MSSFLNKACTDLKIEPSEYPLDNQLAVFLREKLKIANDPLSIYGASWRVSKATGINPKECGKLLGLMDGSDPVKERPSLQQIVLLSTLCECSAHDILNLALQDELNRIDADEYRRDYLDDCMATAEAGLPKD